jgi:hypothetical protein
MSVVNRRFRLSSVELNAIQGNVYGSRLKISNVSQISSKSRNVSVSICSMPKSCEIFDPIKVVSFRKNKKGERNVPAHHVLCLTVRFP